MHPRSLFSPREEIVFHVTNNGWSPKSPSSASAVLSDVTLAPALLAELVPLGVDAALDELPLEGERRRDTAAGLAGESMPVSVGDVAWYFFHSASVWRRVSAERFSREAARLSKQNAQWASVAMVS